MWAKFIEKKRDRTSRILTKKKIQKKKKNQKKILQCLRWRSGQLSFTNEEPNVRFQVGNAIQALDDFGEAAAGCSCQVPSRRRILRAAAGAVHQDGGEGADAAASGRHRGVQNTARKIRDGKAKADFFFYVVGAAELKVCFPPYKKKIYIYSERCTAK